MNVEPLGDENRAAALALLERFKETSLFLLGNLAEHGPVLGAALNSGNFKCLVEHGEVVAVWSLTRRGNLCLQSDRQRDYSTWILDACAHESIAFGGVIGDYALAASLHAELVRRRPRFVATFHSKEYLLALDLTRAVLSETSFAVRTLERDDYAQWEPLNRAFMEEEGLPLQGSAEQRQQSFRARVERNGYWGAFHQGRLCSTAGLSAHVGDTGQIGSVFTTAELRRKGFSRAVMTRLLRDCRAREMRKLVLCTGEHNRAARAMYASLGFEPIGYFGLIFGAER